MQLKLKNVIRTFFNWIRVPRSIPGSAVFVFVAALVVLNLVVLLCYTSYSKYEQNIANVEEVVSQLLNTVYLIKISPESRWQTIVDVSETPEVKLSISDTPQWQSIITADSVSELPKTLDHTADHFTVSVTLQNNRWLNVNYTAKSTTEFMQVFIVALAGMVAFALLFSAWSLMRFTRPLREFKRAAEQLGVELGGNPVIEYGPAIVRETAFAMDQMQSRIQNLLRDKNQMLAAISHDLRSPITRLKLRAQFLPDQTQAREWVTDLDEMDAMIEQILTYTKDVAKTEELVDFDLVALVYALSDEYAEHGYSIRCSSQFARLAFKGRSLGLKRAIDNIMSNAVKYASDVEIKIHGCKNKILIIVVDNGPGIPEAQLAKVFTAFYRVDTARTAKVGGTGLGLAITQDIIHAHKGTITLSNRAPNGLIVTVALPI